MIIIHSSIILHSILCFFFLNLMVFVDWQVIVWITDVMGAYGCWQQLAVPPWTDPSLWQASTHKHTHVTGRVSIKTHHFRVGWGVGCPLTASQASEGHAHARAHTHTGCVNAWMNTWRLASHSYIQEDPTRAGGGVLLFWPSQSFSVSWAGKWRTCKQK